MTSRTRLIVAALGLAAGVAGCATLDTWQRKAIFQHERQKDSAVFPGSTDPREFWQRAEDRNRETARLYDKLGLPEYEAIEGFVLHRG